MAVQKKENRGGARNTQRTSIEEKKATGTYNEKVHGVDIPLSGRKLGNPPPYLITDEEKYYFEYYKSILQARKMDAIEYTDILGLLAQAIYDVNRIRECILNDGGFMVGATPTTRSLHPLTRELRSSQSQMLKLIRSMGFTPDTMSKVVSKKEAYSVDEPEESFFD